MQLMRVRHNSLRGSARCARRCQRTGIVVVGIDLFLEKRVGELGVLEDDALRQAVEERRKELGFVGGRHGCCVLSLPLLLAARDSCVLGGGVRLRCARRTSANQPLLPVTWQCTLNDVCHIRGAGSSPGSHRAGRWLRKSQ